jgi:hypothetical protein
MAVGYANLPSITQNNPTPRDLGGSTGLEQANQFVTIRTAGVRELVDKLNSLVTAVEADETLRRIVRRASRIVMNEYKTLAERHEATGNLAKSVTIVRRSYNNGRGGKAAVDIIGPRQTGRVASQEGVESGNHAWLVEFGSGPRRPGTQGRRTYINVHQSINRRMKLHPGKSMNDDQFKNAGRGYYFLMGSLRERAGAGGRSGYSRDFAGPGPRGDGREQHPITLKPGETIAPMPAHHIMRDVIIACESDVQSSLEIGLINAINARLN